MPELRLILRTNKTSLERSSRRGFYWNIRLSLTKLLGKRRSKNSRGYSKLKIKLDRTR